MYCFDFCFIETLSWDLAGGPVVKNLPSNAGSESSIPGGRTKIPHVTEQLNPCTMTTEAQVLAAAAAAKSLQLCLTLRPHRRQPTRLPRPWDSSGKNTGVGCHFLSEAKRNHLLLCVSLCNRGCFIQCFILGIHLYLSFGFLGGSDGKESACSAGDRVRSLGQEDPLEKGMATCSNLACGGSDPHMSFTSPCSDVRISLREPC